jgi:hypothetical protein
MMRLLLFIAALIPLCAAAEPAKQNFIIIFTDD